MDFRTSLFSLSARSLTSRPQAPCTSSTRPTEGSRVHHSCRRSPLGSHRCRPGRMHSRHPLRFATRLSTVSILVAAALSDPRSHPEYQAVSSSPSSTGGSTRCTCCSMLRSCTPLPSLSSLSVLASRSRSQEAQSNGMAVTPVLIFPQNAKKIPGYENWKPEYIDYLFLSFHTSSTVGPNRYDRPLEESEDHDDLPGNDIARLSSSCLPPVRSALSGDFQQFFDNS